ncbi:MAG: hypothetical protein LBH25_04770 [Fibromonadaceae bacterium]|jgi:hypothetical protein|nr:hypothetical protein [Fibromonadaceae bacterium]
MVANLYANIPLPNRNVAQVSGLSGGAGLGSLRHLGCKNLWTWSTHGKFSYDSTIAAGPSIKFTGGNLDTTKNLVLQRYSIDVEFNRMYQKYAIFAGPSFSFENVNLSHLIDEFSHIGNKQQEEKPETKCSELFSEIGSSIGYQSGIGFLLSPEWGLALGHTLDLTFKGTYLISFSGSIALNLRSYFEKLVENTKNVWLSLEYSASFTKKSLNIQDFIFGLALGF